jgi:hypothetical protein
MAFAIIVICLRFFKGEIDVRLDWSCVGLSIIVWFFLDGVLPTNGLSIVN